MDEVNSNVMGKICKKIISIDSELHGSLELMKTHTFTYALECKNFHRKRSFEKPNHP